MLHAGLEGKGGVIGRGANGGSWPGGSGGQATCRNGTELVYHKKVKIDTIMAVGAYGLL